MPQILIFEPLVCIVSMLLSTFSSFTIFNAHLIILCFLYICSDLNFTTNRENRDEYEQTPKQPFSKSDLLLTVWSLQPSWVHLIFVTVIFQFYSYQLLCKLLFSVNHNPYDLTTPIFGVTLTIVTINPKGWIVQKTIEHWFIDLHSQSVMEIGIVRSVVVIEVSH